MTTRFSVIGSGRVMKSDEKIVLRFSNGRGDPHTDVCSNHVHKTEARNGFVLADNNLHIKYIQIRKFCCNISKTFLIMSCRLTHCSASAARTMILLVRQQQVLRFYN